MRVRLRRAAARQEGGVAIIVAISGVVLVAFTAFAVDLGWVFLQTRQLQGMADLAAISAANDLKRATQAAEATVAVNGFDKPVKADVATGTYRRDPAIAPADRFVAGATTPNAARVVLHSEAHLFFGQVLLGKPTVPISRRATAERAELVSFSIGSRLAALHGGLVNDLLSGLTGSAVNLSVMDYNALLDADVDLLNYVEALQIHANLKGASFDKVLEGEIATGAALSTLADSLPGGEAAAAAALRKIAAASESTGTIKLGDLLDLGPYGQQDAVASSAGAGVSVKAMDMANAILQLANEGRQVKLDVGANVPQLASVNAWLAIGERPNNSSWIAIDANRETVVRTAQTRLYLEAVIAPGGGLLKTLGVTGVTLPILVEAASGEAKVSALRCDDDRDLRGADLLVKPSVGRVAIAQVNRAALNDFKQKLVESPAQIVGLPLLKVTGQAGADIGGVTWQAVTFSQSDIDAKRVKTVATRDVAKALVATLVEDLDLNVNLAGLLIALPKSPVVTAVASILAAAAPGIDNLINGLTDLIGLRVGEADVRVNGLRCNAPVLVA